jgi:hypothetical protein
MQSGAVARKKSTRGGRRPGAGRKRELVDPVRFTVDVERADFTEVESVAAKTGVSRGSVVRDAIRTYIAFRRKG